MRWLDDTVDAVDRVQRRHAVLGFPLAVWKRYGEEHGGWLGAVISYYGFLALVPLLLVFVTVVTMVFDENPDLMNRILNAVWSQLPFVGEDIRESVKPIAGNPAVVLVSLLVALWGALNVVRVCQDTVNRMWGVPRFRRPGFFPKVGRSVASVGLLGLGVIGSAVISGLTVGLEFPVASVVAAGVGNFVANTLITLGLFRVLTARRLAMREMLPGAVVIGAGTYALTFIGARYVQRIVAEASSFYGSFAAMVGLFAWIALMVQVFVFGTLVNVVRAERLWPRTLSGRNLGAGDTRAFELTRRRSQMYADDLLAPTPLD